MKYELKWFNRETGAWWLVRVRVVRGKVEWVSARPWGSKLRGTVSGPRFRCQIPDSERDWIESEVLTAMSLGSSNSTAV